jgi:hypothetical protein
MFGLFKELKKEYERIIPKQPEPILTKEIVEFVPNLEYKDGFGYWYNYTEDLQNNEYFVPFETRVKPDEEIREETDNS